MSKRREIVGPAVKAIRELKASMPASEDHDPTQFRGSKFAAACQMSHGHLCNIEQDRKKKTPLATIQRIADQLGVPFQAISHEVEDVNASPVRLVA